MSTSLDKAELSTVESLEAIKADQAVIAERISAMEAKKASVAEAVYTRVRADYEQRAAELRSRATPLQDQLREHYRKFEAAVAELAQACEAADLERQEIEFRHELGEYDEAEFKSRLKTSEQTLGKTREQREKTEALMKRIHNAFLDPESLSQASRPADNPFQTQPMDAVDDTPAEPENNELAPTQVIPAVGNASPPPSGGAATTVLRSAKLLPQNPLAGQKPYHLGLRPITIGSKSSCEIRIGGDKVGEQHARITVSAQGFSIEDLGCEIGTLVNGERVTTRRLANDDLIQIGAARLQFKDR